MWQGRDGQALRLFTVDDKRSSAKHRIMAGNEAEDLRQTEQSYPWEDEMKDRIILGACYYPEQWPESLWAEDLVRMKAHGIQRVRVGEFAWALFEPEEGVFDFALFDRFLSLAARQGMEVIMGTPTATPPIWLTERYPQVLNATPEGTLYRHGLRRHYSYNSAIYRSLTARIVQKMGEHFGHHPAIVGWQIDNELNCERDEFYSEADHEAFRTYMRRRFLTLDRLNECMGGSVWSQRYTDWDQVHLRRPTPHDQYNPHMLLEERRFFSESAVDFCRLQSDILRPLIGERFITTNGNFGHLNYPRLMAGSLDFLCYDSYPNFALDLSHDPGVDDGFRDRNWSRHLAQTRAFSPRFGIMEQQAGANGWTGRLEAPMPRPGQMRLWTLQSLAHGADFISYFRWRTAPCGTEIYWHGLNDYDNSDNRRLQELRQIHADLQRLQPLAGEPYRARVACLRDFDNEWDAEVDRWHGRVEAVSQKGLFRAAQRLHEPMDYVYLDEAVTAQQLAPYALLIYPHATILEDGVCERLEAYLRAGGQVLFGARTGYKDRYGRCPMRPMGFGAAKLCGIRIADYTFVGPYDEPGMAEMGGEALEMPVFNDILRPVAPDARVEAVYTSNYYAGQPALISRPVGRGRAWYYGAALSEASAMALLGKLGFGEPFGGIVGVPEDCEVALRGRHLFVLNYQRDARTLDLRVPARECLSGEQVSGRFQLPPFGVAVFEVEAEEGLEFRV